MKYYITLCLAILAIISVSTKSYAGVLPGGAYDPVGPTFALDFMSGAVDSRLTYTRSGNAWYFNSAGLLSSVSTNVPRFDYDPTTLQLKGLLIEQNRENDALYSRDLSNAVWTKTNATAALNVTGLDGTANSASTLTATGSNATALQTYTLSSNAGVFSVYLKRVSGTGTVNITNNNGTTWTPVTLTSTWTRFKTPAVTQVNPTFGIQITTSGDAVAWDVGQFEWDMAGGNSPSPSSPIVTTSIKIVRNTDTLGTSSLSWLTAGQGTLLVESQTEGGQVSCLFSLNDTTTNNQIDYRTGQGFGFITTGGVTQWSPNYGAYAANTIHRYGISYKSTGGIAYQDSSLLTNGAMTIPTVTTLNLGACVGNSYQLFGWLRTFKYWNYAMSGTQLLTVTTR